MTSFDAEFFKSTVFLPKTDFPMRGDLPAREPAIVAQWQKMDMYNRLRAASKGRKKWVLHWGPPYANGAPHIGHAFTKTLKDVVVRSHQMMGYDAPLVPGWDCHGLPIEWKIEEEYRAQGRDKDAVSPIDFREECRAYAKKWIAVQSESFERLGVCADWANPYLTLSNEGEAQIAREIHKILLNGGLYKGVKPVMWSVVEQTALAEAEVEYKEHKSITCWVKFPVKSGASDLAGTSIVIWTTTPWTLPSNRALAYGENIAYGLYEIKEIGENSKAIVGDKIVIAQKLADDVREKAQIVTLEKLRDVAATELEGLTCHHPLYASGYDYDVPMLAGDFVTDDTGTGFVHIAPSHGEDDYYLYISRFGAEHVGDNVTNDGRYRPHVPLFAGLEIYTQKGEMGPASGAVLKALEQAGMLVAKGSLRHEYPHSWRSKAPLIFRATPQWFVSMERNGLRTRALEAIANTRWVPKQGENRIRAMIEQRPDWCISRQRIWGVPIAIFIEKATDKPLMDESVYKRVADIFEVEGADAWWARPASDFLGAGYNPDDYVQVMDTVDVWFDSASTHAFVLERRPELKWPADLYLEGSDQHRGWFHTSLLEACATRGRAPFDAVLTHGFVLDEKGMKMSKSIGNTVAPEKLMATYGADIVRLWAILSDYSEDVRIGDAILKTTTDVYRRIRNTFRYVLGALEGVTAAEMVDLSNPATLPPLEAYMLHRLATLDRDIRAAIAAFEFGRVASLVYNFCNSDLSAFYFDIRKDRLYCDRPDAFERRACRTVMTVIFESLCCWLAPVLCFTTEDAWAHRPAGVFDGEVDSIHLRQFPTMPAAWLNESLPATWGAVLHVRDSVLGALEVARTEKLIGSALEAHAHIFVDTATQALFATAQIDMAEIAITSQATIHTGAAPTGAYTQAGKAGISVVIAKAEGQKCERCWKILPSVGSDPEFPTLTPRDADAVRYFISQNKQAA